MKREMQNFFLSAMGLLSLIFFFLACSSDNDDPIRLDPQDYSIEIILKGDMAGYSKRAFIGGGAFSSVETTIIDDLTGKDLLVHTLEDDEYIFKEYNKFSLSKKVEYFDFSVWVSRVSQWSDDPGDLTVTIKVYRNGKLLDTFEKTATKDLKIQMSKNYYEGDL